MNQIPKYQQGIQYSEDVRNAVRYGYLYRKEAEKADGVTFHHYLPDPSSILLFLGQSILGGLAWDGTKALAKKIYSQFLKTDNPLSEELNTLLTEEQELNKFYTYVKEFNEHNMSVSKKQFDYIREEICADFFAKEAVQIIEKEHREPTHDEYMEIYRRVNASVDRLMVLNPIC